MNWAEGEFHCVKRQSTDDSDVMTRCCSTSTFDGLSIAYSVLHQLAGHLGCIGFFATHFTSLVDDFAGHPQIAQKHMQTHVDDETKEVTFLYKLTEGCVLSV